MLSSIAILDMKKKQKQKEYANSVVKGVSYSDKHKNACIEAKKSRIIKASETLIQW